MVEALTIILAVAVTRGWRPVVLGTLGAVVGLGGLVAVLGPAVTSIPLNSLRLVVEASCWYSDSSGCARPSCEPAA